MAINKVVLITGASSGFGKAIALKLAEKGYSVFGTSRNPEKVQMVGINMLRLDVRSDESVKACVHSVLEAAGRIDVLINNAGYELAGALEETSTDEAKQQFETNFFGAAGMIKEALPFMRRQGGGRIINVGSLAGLIGVPFHGFYSASKFALEGYSETLRHEVRGFNIKVSILEPSFMRTNLGRSSLTSVHHVAEYSRMRRQAFAFFEQSLVSGETPASAAASVVRIIECTNPRLRYRLGKEAKRVPRIKALLPQKMFESGMRRHFRLDHDQKTAPGQEEIS